MGLTALLPFRRKACCGFLSPLKIHRPRPGLNPQTFSSVASTLAITRSRTTFVFFFFFFFAPEGGVDQTHAWMRAYASILSIPLMIGVWRTTVE
jgi:hypothetical protein